MPYPGFQALFLLSPQDAHFCLLPWPLLGYALGVLSSTPGRPSFPTQPVTPLPTPRGSEETSYLGGQAGRCRSHSHHPDPSSQRALLEAAQTPPTLRVTFKPEPGLRGCKDHTQQDVHAPTLGPLSLPGPHTDTHLTHCATHRSPPLGGTLLPLPVGGNKAIQHTAHLTLSLQSVQYLLSASRHAQVLWG